MAGVQKHLPLLNARRKQLETCGYCPKLCRAECPVSNVEPKESLIPWGKMTLAWYLSRSDVPLTNDFVGNLWACTGCFKCTESCEHRNPTFDTLLAARQDVFSHGVAPRRVSKFLRALPVFERRNQERLAKLELLPGVERAATHGLLVGCGYLSYSMATAEAIVRLCVSLRGRVRLLQSCCGLPWLYAGDQLGFEVMRARFAAETRGLVGFSIADPGCAMVLRDEERAELLIDQLARFVDRLGPLPAEIGRQEYRYHDPCQLGRGLGRYDEPRTILARLLERPVSEFANARDRSDCSGAGGLLGLTHPAISREIAAKRTENQSSPRDCTIVTGCAASLRRFASTNQPAIDLYALAEKGLPRK